MRDFLRVVEDEAHGCQGAHGVREDCEAVVCAGEVGLREGSRDAGREARAVAGELPRALGETEPRGVVREERGGGGGEMREQGREGEERGAEAVETD